MSSICSGEAPPERPLSPPTCRRLFYASFSSRADLSAPSLLTVTLRTYLLPCLLCPLPSHVSFLLTRGRSKNRVSLLWLTLLRRSWDTDGDGRVDAHELRQAIASLGYSAPKDDIHSVFSLLDTDGSGAIDYNELNRALRRGAQLAPELRVGAVGPIELTAKNRSSKGLPPLLPPPPAESPPPIEHRLAQLRAEQYHYYPGLAGEARKREANRQILEQRKALALSLSEEGRHKQERERAAKRNRAAEARSRKEAQRREKAATALQARCRGMRERTNLKTTADPLDTLRRRARAHLDHTCARIRAPPTLLPSICALHRVSRPLCLGSPPPTCTILAPLTLPLACLLLASPHASQASRAPHRPAVLLHAASPRWRTISPTRRRSWPKKRPPPRSQPSPQSRTPPTPPFSSQVSISRRSR